MVSEVLRHDIDAFVDAVRRTNRLLLLARVGQLGLPAVRSYLSGIRYLLWHTPVHLRLARDISLSRGEAKLAEYFVRKLEEETGHHEWADSDLASLDAEGASPPGDVAPKPTMIELVRGSRALIERDPRAFLAHIMFAEYFTVVMGPEWLDALERSCGIPPSSMTAVGRHVELDQQHVKEGSRDIDELVTDSEGLAVLRDALRETMGRFVRFTDDVADAA